MDSAPGSRAASWRPLHPHSGKLDSPPHLEEILRFAEVGTGQVLESCEPIAHGVLVNEQPRRLKHPYQFVRPKPFEGYQCPRYQRKRPPETLRGPFTCRL
jgi:hypothetical protein